MKGYQIEYGTWSHDCWGAPEFYWDGVWDNKIYTDPDKAEEACKSLYRNGYEFRLKEVEVDLDLD